MRGVSTKAGELCSKLKGRNINTVIISETKKKLKRSKINGFALIYSEVDQHKHTGSAVAIISISKMKSKTESYTYIRDRILTEI